jgi:lipopolysaccharide/colanic/teichoic acid biosynthesis glycosyltransferase
VNRQPRHGYLVGKRFFDLLLITVALPVLVPLFLLCALAIRLDSPGAPVFTQVRTGRDGHRFRMYKFRTMVRNAEELKASLQHLSVVPAPDFKVPNDPRITRVGRVLRATSLDELPQLINVVKGDMSLVGPRPTSMALDKYELWHTRRLDVRPGLTGLWQVAGRNTTTFDERLRLDDEYIRTMSMTTDLGILWRTVGSVVSSKGQ